MNTAILLRCRHSFVHHHRNLRLCVVALQQAKQTGVDKQQKTHGSLLEEILVKKDVPQTTTAKAKEYGKDFTSLIVIAGGLALTGGLAYAIFSELFSSKSPTVVYSRALKLVEADDRVCDILGSGIKGFGEETRRGRRRHVMHSRYDDGRHRGMNLKFYVKGSQKSGTVFVEVREDENGKYNYRYVIVEIDGFPPQTVSILDKR